MNELVPSISVQNMVNQRAAVMARIDQAWRQRQLFDAEAPRPPQQLGLEAA